MRVASLPFTLLLVVMIQVPSFAQQAALPVASSSQIDPQAVSVIQNSLLAMGTASLPAIQDTEMQAQVSVPGGDASPPSAITLRTLGTHFLRVESTTADGLAVWTMNDKEVWTKSPTAAPQFVPLQSLGGGGITHIPLFSILSDWSLPGMRVEYIALEKLNSSTVHHVRLTPALEDGAPRELQSPCEIYIDQHSFFVSRLIYSVRPPSDLKQSALMDVSYQDYKVISGIAVPHGILYTLQGQAIEQYSITSFVVNVGVQKSAFTMGNQL